MFELARETRPRRLGRAAFSVAVIGAVAGTLVMLNRSVVPYGSVTEQETLALVVRVEPVVLEQSLTVHRRFVGVVVARRESRIGFELGGQVARVLVDEGDMVEEGQVLARLDTALLDAERAMLLASRDEAASRLALAYSTRRRVREARELDAVSMQALDDANTNYDVHAAALARAEAAVAQVDARSDKATITAPFEGIVAERHVDEGQVASAGAPVIYLLEVSNPEARIGVAGDAVGALKVGETRWVTVDGRPVAARIVSLLPLRNARTRTVEVRLALEGTLRDLRRGDLVAIEIGYVRQTSGTWLRLSALTESSRGAWAAYVVESVDSEDADGASHRLIRRDVEIVHADAERAFVRGTLAAGDTVVVEGLQRLVPGQRVRLVSDVAQHALRSTTHAGLELEESPATGPETARLEEVR